ncbi:MAG: hypothetical protein ACYC1T_11150 [Sulfuricaulis sp.]
MRIAIVGEVAGKNLALLLLFFSAISPLQAGQFAYGLGYMATHSDNITREASNERSEVVHSYLAGFSYLENTADLVARVFAQATYYDYQDDVFTDEDVYNLNSSLVWTISPQRFTWTVEDAYEETQIVATAADTPANRTNINVFSTGPDLYVRLNPVNTLAFGARVGNVSTSEANIDNDRLSASARWLYEANSYSAYSLNFETLDVNYDDTISNIDYTRHDAFARVDYHPSRSQYLIDLGATKISPERGKELEGSLTRLSWIRQLTQESSFGLSASGEYADTGADILAASTAAGLTIGAPGSTTTTLSSDVVTGDVYYAKRANMFYTRRGSQFRVNFSANTQDIDFEITAQDRKENAGFLEIGYFYSETTSVILFTEQAKIEYQNFFRRDTDRDSGIRLGYRVSRSIGLELEGRRTDRSSTDPNAEFEENRVFLSILYSSGQLFSPMHTR